MSVARLPMGPLERAVMEVLWNPEASHRGLTVREVLSGLKDRNPAYTTVMTVLTRLTKKGIAVRDRDGRAWRYRATESREAMAAQAMRGQLDDLAREDQQSAILHFIERASAHEIATLKAALALVEKAARRHRDAK